MKLTIPLLLIFIGNLAWAQGGREFGVGYTYASPTGTMKQNISRGNGVTLDFYYTPQKNNRLSYGLDLNYTIYGHDKSRQEYAMPDGSTAPMDIIVDNSFTNLLGGVRYYIAPPEGRVIKPYITAKGGYSWFRTNLNIYDPDETDQCKPLEHDLLMKDGTFSISGGAGFHWDLSSIFKSMGENVFLFNIGANVVLGSKVKYMNTDADHHHHNPTTPSSDAVTAKFLNTQTQIVHEHHVGNVYSSFMEMVDFRAGFIFRRP